MIEREKFSLKSIKLYKGSSGIGGGGGGGNFIKGGKANETAIRKVVEPSKLPTITGSSPEAVAIAKELRETVIDSNVESTANEVNMFLNADDAIKTQFLARTNSSTENDAAKAIVEHSKNKPKYVSLTTETDAARIINEWAMVDYDAAISIYKTTGSAKSVPRKKYM